MDLSRIAAGITARDASISHSYIDSSHLKWTKSELSANELANIANSATRLKTLSNILPVQSENLGRIFAVNEAIESIAGR